jgi:hypothetical protein
MTKRMLRNLVIGLIALSCGGLVSACGSFSAVTKGECNPGRTWVDPVKEDGTWRDGYCRNN